VAWTIYFLSVAALWAFFALTKPLDIRLVMILSIATALLAIPAYFENRRARFRTPSTIERIAARSWLWLRRVVGGLGAALFLLAAVAGIVSPPSSASTLERLVMPLVMLGLVGLCVWIAWVGQGPHRHLWRDDLKLHRDNQKRYRWK
jgi:hypothetical protein